MWARSYLHEEIVIILPVFMHVCLWLLLSFVSDIPPPCALFYPLRLHGMCLLTLHCWGWCAQKLMIKVNKSNELLVEC